MRRIIVFDVETTGTDRRQDQIIELCVQFGIDSTSKRRTWRVKPDVPISAGAQAVHGISMEALANSPSFAAVLADEFRAIVAEADVLVGYNLSFDIEMVQAEYARLKQPALDLAGKMVIDPFRLWQQCEPRTLQDAHRRFVGDSFGAAHSASADVAATGRVLTGMLEAFGLSSDWSAVAKVCEPGRRAWVGDSRHIQWRDADTDTDTDTAVAVIGFGKHAGSPVWELAHGPDSGYLRWIMDKDFPAHVHEICKAAFEMDREGFSGWLKKRFDADAAPELVAGAARASAIGPTN